MAAQQKNTLSQDISQYLSVCRDFNALLLNETKALKAADFKAVDALQAKKQAMAKEYVSAVTALAERKDEFKALAPDARAIIVETRTAFTVTLDDNMRALTAVKDGARRLVDRILDTARKTVTRETHTHYSAKGQAQSYKTASMSINIDRQL